MRITLIRHGESMANIKQHDYSAVGDHMVPLTERGVYQAQVAGNMLGDELQDALDGKTLVYCSPYLRTRQTLENMFIGAYLKDRPTIYEDPRLRETDHGYEGASEQKPLRAIHGWFYYRYRGGESPADCSDRVSNYLESMMRQRKRKGAENIVIVSHGLTIRCFLMRFMHLKVEEFEKLANPDNCDIITIDLKENIAEPTHTCGRWAMMGIKQRKKR